MTERDEAWLRRTLTSADDDDGGTGALLAGVKERRRAARQRRVGAAAAASALAVGAVVLAVTTLGGGPDTAVDRPDPPAGFPTATTPYDGPLSGVDGRYAAAGPVLDCPAVEGGTERDSPYAEGATSDSVAGAVDTALSEGLFLSVPDVDLVTAKTEPDRVLLTYAPAGRTVLALVFRDGPATDGAGGPGWYLESWARCDLSAFPAQDAAELGYLIWRDADGDPVPVSEVSSGPGPEHCDWDDLTFLTLDERAVYVRAPDRSVRDLVQGVYSVGLPLPADAVATGYQRDGQRLWRSGDAGYVYVGQPGSVEAWPRFEGGCA